MHDCALGRKGGTCAPRVEHRYYPNGWVNTDREKKRI